MSRASPPYFTTDNVYYTSYQYDVLNRLTRTELPFLDDFGQTAAIQQAYSLDGANRRTVTTTDVKGRSRTTYANALSQVVEIQDANSNSLTYSFDSQGNLKRTVDAAGNTINVGYDLLGRRTSLNDPDMGLSSFSYNAFSEMTSQTDAKGQTISMIYDKLGRMTTRSVPGSASESGGSSVFTYDTAANGVGAIASVSGPNGYLKTHSYDQYSRPSGDVTTIKGGSYTQSYGYNANGQLATRSYPDSGAGQAFSVNYNYLNGYLSSITGGDPHSANCIEHWRADKYDALGRAEEETLGKLVTTTRSYKPGQGVLEHIQSIINVNQGGTVQDLSYTYDAANNLATRSDAVNASTESFIYDSQFQYDANGNIKVSGDRYVWWTAFDKPYRMERYNGANGSVTTGSTLEYDAEFNRIYKLQDDGQATVYIGKEYERITEADGGIIHRYTINTGGAAIQIERADGTGFDQPKYLLTDNLGSTNVILDASGNVEQTLAFDPWGMRTNTGDITAVNSITNKGYTGHEMDDEVGLVNMNARIYDPYLGRFLSADPVLPNPYDMQAYNRYSYVSNNPLKYTDPTGNRECEDNGCDPDELDEPNAIWVFVDYVEVIIDTYDAPEAPADVSDSIPGSEYVRDYQDGNEIHDAFQQAILYVQENDDVVEWGGYIGTNAEGVLTAVVWAEGDTVSRTNELGQVSVGPPALDENGMYNGITVTGEFHTHPNIQPLPSAEQANGDADYGTKTDKEQDFKTNYIVTPGGYVPYNPITGDVTSVNDVTLPPPPEPVPLPGDWNL